MGNFNPKLPTKYAGTNKYITFFVTRDRSPTGADYRQPETGTLYSIGTVWQVGKSPSTGTEGDLWMLSKIVANVATWTLISSGGIGLESFITNIAGPVVPNGSAEILVNASSTTFTDGATVNTLKTEVQAAAHNLLVGQGTNVAVASLAPSATVGVPVVSQGAAADPIYGTASIAGGGTNATSMSTSDGIVKYDGTRLVTSTTAKIDSSNRITNTSQPSFFVYLNTPVTNVTGDGTVYSVLFDTSSYDIGSGITLNSAGKTIYTVPVTGTYSFTACLNTPWSSDATGNSVLFELVNATSGFTYRFFQFNQVYGLESAILGCASNVIVKVTAGDVLSLTVSVNGATAKNAGLQGKSGAVVMNYFSGVLLY